MTLRDLQQRLSLAFELIANGVPVFVAKPVPASYPGHSEFFFPSGWPYIDASPRHLDDYQPGWAVCAVTGVKFDVVDVDPRHGGDASYTLLECLDAAPRVLGRVDTPSGGYHIYTNRSYLRKSTPWKGIDVQAGDIGGNGKGFVYIPPTVRKGKAYVLTERIQWENLVTTESNYIPFYERLLATYKFTPQEIASYRVAKRGPRSHTPEEIEEVLDKATALCVAVSKARVGNRDILLNKYAYTLGGMVTGSGLDAQFAVNMLATAAERWGVTKDELQNWVYPKIERGVEQGKAYPIDIFAFEEDAFGRTQ